MHEAFDITEAERQDGLGAFKRLDLHLFVNAQHNRMIRRIEVEPDDVFDLECARVIRSKSSRSLPTTVDTHSWGLPMRAMIRSPQCRAVHESVRALCKFICGREYLGLHRSGHQRNTGSE